MQIDNASWNQVSGLFDELVDLESPEREHRLRGLTLDDPSRRLLHQLLSAHDSSDSHLLDQTLNRIAADRKSTRLNSSHYS